MEKKKKNRANPTLPNFNCSQNIFCTLSLFFIPFMPLLFSAPPNPTVTENAPDEALSLYYSLSLSRKR